MFVSKLNKRKHACSKSWFNLLHQFLYFKRRLLDLVTFFSNRKLGGACGSIIRIFFCFIPVSSCLSLARRRSRQAGRMWRPTISTTYLSSCGGGGSSFTFFNLLRFDFDLASVSGPTCLPLRPRRPANKRDIFMDSPCGVLHCLLMRLHKYFCKRHFHAHVDLHFHWLRIYNTLQMFINIIIQVLLTSTNSCILLPWLASSIKQHHPCIFQFDITSIPVLLPVQF